MEVQGVIENVDIDDEQNGENQVDNVLDPSEEKNRSRRSNRRRSATSCSRYSPGEGGGLDHKRQRVQSADVGRNSSAVSSERIEVVKSLDAGVTIDDPGNVSENVPIVHHSKNGNCNNIMIKQDWIVPTYHWLDEGIRKSDGLFESNAKESIVSGSNCVVVEHTGLMINFSAKPSESSSDSSCWKCAKCDTNHLITESKCSSCRREHIHKGSSTDCSPDILSPPLPLLIRRGDNVLISHVNSPLDFFNQSLNGGHTSLSIYNDPASSEPGLELLDPYVARIERMWEEVDDQNDFDGRRSAENNPTQMKILTRWYLRREEIEGLNCSFVLKGKSKDIKQDILDDMAVCDLMLSDQVDVNLASSILGKATVIILDPLSLDKKTEVPKGAFMCQYRLKLDSSDKARGMLFPCPNNLADETEQAVDTPHVIKETDTHKELSSNIQSSDDDYYQSYNSVNEAFSTAPYSGHLTSPRRVISEGITTTGRIKVGLAYQADIPSQEHCDPSAGTPSQRMPIMVWNPVCDEVDVVNGFLTDACSILSKSMMQTPFHELNSSGSPDTAEEAHKPREFSIDGLLAELHESNYDRQSALDNVSNNPTKFMVSWNCDEKQQFDAEFRVYRDALRMISRRLNDKKSCKDVVDYYYRFKLVENFRRFKMKKCELACKMMETVECRVLKEKWNVEAQNVESFVHETSSSDEDGFIHVGCNLSDISLNGAGHMNNRIRTWFRTGGRKTDISGATQIRRDSACRFLAQIKDEVGIGAYRALAKSLKTYNLHCESSLVDIKSNARDIMKTHPHLFDRFVRDFLPKELR